MLIVRENAQKEPAKIPITSRPRRREVLPLSEGKTTLQRGE